MPEFMNPFSGMVPDRKMTRSELIRAARLALSAEQEAVHLYMAMADATEDPLARKIFIDVADEERAHIGEFARLIQILTGDEDRYLKEGAEEVDEMRAEIGGAAAPESETPSGDESTIGSMKGEENG